MGHPGQSEARARGKAVVGVEFALRSVVREQHAGGELAEVATRSSATLTKKGDGRTWQLPEHFMTMLVRRVEAGSAATVAPVVPEVAGIGDYVKGFFP